MGAHETPSNWTSIRHPAAWPCCLFRLMKCRDSCRSVEYNNQLSLLNSSRLFNLVSLRSGPLLESVLSQYIVLYERLCERVEDHLLPIQTPRTKKKTTFRQPPPQALRFSHGRGECETSDWWWNTRDHGKGIDGRRSTVSPVVSFPPSFARTFSSKERRLDTRPTFRFVKT